LHQTPSSLGCAQERVAIFTGNTEIRQQHIWSRARNSVERFRGGRGGHHLCADRSEHACDQFERVVLIVDDGTLRPRRDSDSVAPTDRSVVEVSVVEILILPGGTDRIRTAAHLVHHSVLRIVRSSRRALVVLTRLFVRHAPPGESSSTSGATIR
jgi:hypothetical protein